MGTAGSAAASRAEERTPQRERGTHLVRVSHRDVAAQATSKKGAIFLVLPALVALSWVFGALLGGVEIGAVFLAPDAAAPSEEEWALAARLLVAWRFAPLPGLLAAQALKHFSQPSSWAELATTGPAGNAGTYTWVGIRHRGEDWASAELPWTALWQFEPGQPPEHPSVPGFESFQPWGPPPFPAEAAWGGGRAALERAASAVEREDAAGLWHAWPGHALAEMDSGQRDPAAIAAAARQLTGHGVDGQVAAWYWRVWDGQRPPAGAAVPPLIPAGRTDPEDYGFRHWHRHLTGDFTPSLCIAAADDGAGVWPSCTAFFSRARPLQLHADEMIGEVIYGDVHKELVPDALRLAYSAYIQSPTRTRGTLRLGVRAAHPSVRSYLSGAYPKLELLHEYLAPETKGEHGPKLNTFRNAAGRYVPCKEGITSDFVIVRFGWSTEQQSMFEHHQGPVRDAATSDEQVFSALCDPPPAGDALFSYQEPVPESVKGEWRKNKLLIYDVLTSIDYGKSWLASQPDLMGRWRDDDMPAPGGDQDWFLHEFGRLDAAVFEQWQAAAPPHLRHVFIPAITAARHGVDLPSKSARPHSFDIANRPSCRDPDKLQRVKKELDDYKARKIVERKADDTPLAEFCWGINALLIVTRTPDDGSGRLCLDPELNAWLLAAPFAMCGPRDRLAAAEKHFWTLRKDLKRAFYINQLTLLSRFVAAFRDPFPPHDVWRFTVPAFGLLSSPRSLYLSSLPCRIRFCLCLCEVASQLQLARPQLAQELRALARSASLRYDTQQLDFYADDWIGLASPLALAVLDFIMEFEGFSVGLPFAPAKDVYGPSVVTLGIEIDCPQQRMWFPRLRAAAYVIVLQQLLSACRRAKAVAGSDWESLLGKIQFVVQSSRWLRWALGPIEAVLHALPRQSDGRAPLFVFPSPLALAFLEQLWLPLLQSAPCWLLSRSRWSVLPLELAAASAGGVSGSDASGTLGMGGVVGTLTLQRPLTVSESGAHIQVLEFRGSWEVLAHRVRADGGRTRRWLLLIDNAGAVADWNKGGRHWKAPDQALGDWFAFALTAAALDLDVRAVHVPGSIIIKLGHDDASRRMWDHGTPLTPAQVPPDGASGSHTPAQFWSAWQRLAVQRPSPLDPFEEFCKVTPQGRNSGCWVVYVVSSDSDADAPDTGSSESEEGWDSEEEDEWFAQRTREATEQLSETRRAAVRAALTEDPLTQLHASTESRACSAQSCRTPHTAPALRCAACPRVFHWQCLGFAVLKQVPVGWRCGVCSAPGGSAVLAAVLHLDEAAAFAATAPAVNSDATHRSALRRFSRTIIALAAESGAELTVAEILPTDPFTPTAEAFALAFVVAASGTLGTERFMLNTVTTTLAGLAAWHRAKSGGQLQGPSYSWHVQRAVKALERHLAAAGTPLVIRAFPAKVVHMEAFWDYFWFRMQQLLQMGVAWSRRYGWSRDFGYKLLIFLAIIRPDEGYGTRFSRVYFRVAPEDPDGRQYCILRAKNHQTTERWVPLRSSGPGRIGFSEWLLSHEQLLHERGVTIGESTPLFGLASDPETALLSSQMLLAKLRDTLVRPALSRAGLEADVDRDWSGYSFRRGGIDAVYRELRAQIQDNTTLIAQLMATGRWKSAASLRVYLADSNIDPALERHFALLGATSRGGATEAEKPANAAAGAKGKRPKEEGQSKPLTAYWQTVQQAAGGAP